jgi:2-polyprenyl-6-methoxyphenol hydroxylase-like FAD-dependent oxidoreductase
MKTEVLIVGAGPTGLMLACQCVRFGLEFVIVEKRDGVTPYSKAIGVHARTLEIYEQFGIAKQAVERGAVSGTVRLLAGGEVRGEFDLSRIGEGMSPYPFILNLEQSKNEQLLYEYLQSHHKDVLWNSELESLSQSEEGVTAQVKTSDGGMQTIEAKYLVGCDGAKSPVRRALGLGFEGSTFERTFYVADAQIDWVFSHDASHFCLSQESFLLFFPLKGENRYRIVGVFPEEFAKSEGEVLYEEIEEHIKTEAQLELDIHDVEWFSTYKVHSRHVSNFGKGRCFLAGDSAHVHTPAGAQGMNTGIQDAYNLVWKMAAVLRGESGEKLLETYNEERLENAKNLLQTTDRLFHLGAGDEWYLAFLRTNVVPPLAGYILGLDAVKKVVFPRISQIGISYRHSSLSQHAGDENFGVKAGDRMPYLKIEGQSIYNRLREAKFHWLLFSDEPEQNTWDTEYSKLIDTHVFPLLPQVKECFGTSKPFGVLLRPDNYIALLSVDSFHSAQDYLYQMINRYAIHAGPK